MWLAVYPVFKPQIIEYLKLEGAHIDHQVQLHQTPARKNIVLGPLENHQENWFYSVIL